MEHSTLIASLQTGCRLNFNPDGTFSAVNEAKCKGINRRANGESAKQLEALNQAVNELNRTLTDKTTLDTHELIDLHQGLSHRINHIKSHTTGFIGWLFSLFRSKEETKALKAVGTKLREARDLVNRTQGAAGILVASNITNQSNAQILKMIRAEFPQLIHQGPITLESFGISGQDLTPKLPFLITVNKTDYTIHLPPYNIDPSIITDDDIITKKVSYLFRLPTIYKNYINDYSRQIRFQINHYLTHTLNQRAQSGSGLLENAHLIRTEVHTNNSSLAHYANISIKYQNPETNQEEAVYVTVNRHTTYEEVKNKVDEAILQNVERATKVKKFLEDTFKNNQDKNGIRLNREEGFYFNPGQIKPKNDFYEGSNPNFNIPHIQVKGLGIESYNKIKAIKEGFEKNAAILQPLLRTFTDVYSIRVKNVLIRVVFDSENNQIILKDSNNQAIYAKVPYTGDLQKTLDDLADILPIKQECKLSSSVLNSVSPLSGDDHVTRLPKVSLNKLKELKKRINSSGHNLSTANDGSPTSKRDILSGIDNIVDMVAKYRAGRQFVYVGIPNDKDERKKYFDELEARLTHIIAALEKPENSGMLSEVMINLGVGGTRCGGRWKDEVTTYYSMLCRPKVDETTIPLDSWLQTQLDQKKQEVVEKMVTEANSINTSHVRLRYLKHLKENGVTVPGWEAATYQDPYWDMGGGVEGDQILEQFNSKFDPARFLIEWKDEISKRLKNYKGDEAAICQNFGAQVTNRLRSAVKTLFLPHMPEHQAKFDKMDHMAKKPEESDEDYKKRIATKKNELLDELIENLNLISVNQTTCVTEGVTIRGMVLLALQTGILEFKTDRNPLEFIETLSTT